MNNLVIAIIIVCGVTIAGTQNDFHTSDLEREVTIAEKIDETTLPPEIAVAKNKTWGVIYPGTKWCGKGNKARNDNDLGRFKRTDRCCRDHDRCPEKIKGGRSNYGIHNNGTVTILSCHCDETFYDCLKGVRTRASKIVGTLYFDIVKNKCFRPSELNSEEYVVVKNRRFSSSQFVRFIGKIFG